MGNEELKPDCMMNLHDTGKDISIEAFSVLSPQQPISISWKNVEYSAKLGFRKGEKKIVSGLNGSFHPGKLIAVMGPSGAGKTTLLNILSGFYQKNVKGEIFVNGSPRIVENFQKMSCYIMQSEHLLQGLTVQQSITIAANLKIRQSIGKAEKDKIISEILTTLGLTRDKKKLVKCLSTGEKKRLTIAMELVNNPSVMLLDEPTSGLDSFTCFRCVQLLKSLAKSGKTVVCTIHQPSSRVFLAFDDLYMLNNGRCIFQGAVSSLIPFLGSNGLQCPPSFNPADFITDIAAGEYGAVSPILEVASKKMTPETETVPPGITNGGFLDDSGKQTEISLGNTLQLPFYGKHYPTSNWNQFSILAERTFFSEIRHPTFLTVRLLAHVLMGCAIGFLYYDTGHKAEFLFKNSDAIFYHILVIFFTGMLPTLTAVPDEMAVFRREHFNNWYSLAMYFFARLVVEIPFQILFPGIYATIIYWLTGHPYEIWRYGYFALMLILCSMASQAFGLMFAVALPVKISIFLAPVSSLLLALFSGIFATYDILPKFLHWLFYVSAIKYSVEGLLLSIYGYNRPRLTCTKGQTCLVSNPSLMLREIDVLNQNILVDILGLIILILVMQALAFLFLKWRMRMK